MREKHESNWLGSLLRHQLSWLFIVAFGLNKKLSCGGLLGGVGLKYFETFISQWFDSKISYIMFLHDHLLGCEISTVRTLALIHNMIQKDLFHQTRRLRGGGGCSYTMVITSNLLLVSLMILSILHIFFSYVTSSGDMHVTWNQNPSIDCLIITFPNSPKLMCVSACV